MKRKLKSELVKLATEIITSDDPESLARLYENARNLYEKLTVLKFIEEKLNDVEIDVSKNVVASKFEKMATAVMNENRSVPESNPHKEDIITPGIDTIKGMVSEMPSKEEVEKIFTEFVAKPETVKSDKDEVTPEISEEKKSSKSLNDVLTENVISVGLNDRLAFVKHLFKENTEDFNRVISQLNTIDTQERSFAFIENMVKPEYENWEGKEEYEERFMQLIIRRFS